MAFRLSSALRNRTPQIECSTKVHSYLKKSVEPGFVQTWLGDYAVFPVLSCCAAATLLVTGFGARKWFMATDVTPNRDERMVLMHTDYQNERAQNWLDHSYQQQGLFRTLNKFTPMPDPLAWTDQWNGEGESQKA